MSEASRSVEALLNWMGTHAPQVSASLTRAGGAFVIDAPDATCVVALLAAHDGQEPISPGLFEEYRLMSVAEIAEVREDLDGMAKVGEWDDKTWQRVDWWVPGWVPVFTDDNSNYICVDTVGSFAGTRGQVVEFIHDDPAREVLAPSFDAWFDAWGKSLEAGAWKVNRADDDGPMLERKRAASGIFAEVLPGYPRKHAATKVKRPPAAKPAAKARGKKPKPEEVALLRVFTDRMGHEEIVAALAKGARTDVRGEQGRTPLHEAMRCGSERPAEALIAAGADLHAKDSHGDTPLHLAGYAHARTAPALIRVLLAAGANPDLPDDEGLPAWFRVSSEEALRAYVDAGVDVTRPGPGGRSLSSRLSAFPAAARLAQSLGA